MQQFLQRNNLDLIIRAHEVFDDGYHLNHGGLVITVFSSSKYSDLNNRAGVIFLDRNKIRIIQIFDEWWEDKGKTLYSKKKIINRENKRKQQKTVGKRWENLVVSKHFLFGCQFNFDFKN